MDGLQLSLLVMFFIFVKFFAVSYVVGRKRMLFEKKVADFLERYPYRKLNINKSMSILHSSSVDSFFDLDVSDPDVYLTTKLDI